MGLSKVAELFQRAVRAGDLRVELQTSAVLRRPELVKWVQWQAFWADYRWNNGSRGWEMSESRVCTLCGTLTRLWLMADPHIVFVFLEKC